MPIFAYFHFRTGEASKNRQSAARTVRFFALPILLCPLCCASTIGAAILTPLIGEVNIIKNPPVFLFGTAEGPFCKQAQSATQCNNILPGLYIAPILLAQSCLNHFTYFSRTRLLLHSTNPLTGNVYTSSRR